METWSVAAYLALAVLLFELAVVRRRGAGTRSASVWPGSADGDSARSWLGDNSRLSGAVRRAQPGHVAQKRPALCLWGPARSGRRARVVG